MAQLPEGTRRAFRLSLPRPRIEREVDDEVAFHLEMRTAELVARGWAFEDAQAEARRMFGDTREWSSAMTEVDRERMAARRRVEWLDDLRQDVRYGVRSLLRTPLFTLLAVLTLALGIGANAAVFGVVKSVLLDALPYADADRVVRVYTRYLDGTQDRIPLAPAMIAEIAERQRSFESLAAFNSTTSEVIYAGDADPRVAKLLWVEPGLFTTLGVPAALGRTFRPDDVGDTARVVVLDHAAWQRLFAGDPEAVGREAVINGIPRTVIGVLPRDFVGPAGEADFYFPLSMRQYLRNEQFARTRHWFGLLGRLAAGVTLDAARAELASIGAEQAREHPQFHGHSGLTAIAVRDAMVGDTRTPLVVLMASAGLVLVITCANLAAALLSRTLSRRKEFAVRVAMGAGRGRLVRQLLTESTVLAVAGGAAGLLLAWIGLTALRGLALPALPGYADLTLDKGAVLVAALIAIATGIAFGLSPALSAGRSNVQGTLRDETRGASESRATRHLRGLLVAGQIALCVSLLAGAGLLARSLWATTNAPLGYDPDDVLAVAVQLPRAGFGSVESRVRFVEQFEERLRALPGVTAVAAGGYAPPNVRSGIGMVVEGSSMESSQQLTPMLLTEVSDGYFRALGIPMHAGRTFGTQDDARAPTVVILSASAARQHWPAGYAVGARIRLGTDADSPAATVIGVVGDVRHDPASPQARHTMYMSIRQAPWNGPVFMVRTQSDPRSLVRPVRATLAEVDPTIPVHEPQTLRSMLDEGLASRRLPVVLMGAFGVLALLLASVGVYAMFAGMAAAREREFGVRIALGSSRADIATLVLRQGGVWMAVGLAAGAFGVVVVARLVRGLLYGAPPFDPVALGLAVGTLLACAAVALMVPVLRAMRADPIRALR